MSVHAPCYMSQQGSVKLPAGVALCNLECADAAIVCGFGCLGRLLGVCLLLHEACTGVLGFGVQGMQAPADVGCRLFCF